MSLTGSQRSMRARAAAFAMHAAGKTNTAAALAAHLTADELAVDPAGTLTPEERARRAALHRKSRMTALALRSSRVRGKRKADAEGYSPASAMEARRDSGERPTAA